MYNYLKNTEKGVFWFTVIGYQRSACAICLYNEWGKLDLKMVLK